MTIKQDTLRILKSDLDWHCSICDLPGAQAKIYQTLRDEGYVFDTTVEGQFYGRFHCKTCGRHTSHRRLSYQEPVNLPKERNLMTNIIRDRVKSLYGNVDQCDLCEYPSKKLEVDHRFPMIRVSGSDGGNDHLGDDGLMDKFIVLTRSNNLRKSRACERCVETGERAYPIGLQFWYDGNAYWDYDADDERGCVGCFWYDPQAWRNSLIHR